MAIFTSSIPKNATDIKVNVVLLDIVFDTYEDISNYQPVIKLSYRKNTENGLIVIVTNLTDEF